jgi:hypothetical protein
MERSGRVERMEGAEEWRKWSVVEEWREWSGRAG